MKPLETMVYAGLLVVALGLSWAQWKGEDDDGGGDSSVVLFDPGAAGLSQLDWDGQKAVASLAIEGKGEDATVWITAGKRAKIEPPKAGDDDDSAAPAAEPTPKPEPTYGEPELKSFPGNDQALKLVDGFSPLKALRQFDGLTDDDRAAMGLDEPKAEIVATAGSKSLTLIVGDKAYGSSDTYVEDKASGSVYLISSKIIGPLRGAESRLLDRDLLGFEATEAEAARISAPDGRAAEARHQGTHDKANAFWSTKDNTDEVDAGLDGFLDKVFTVKASAFLPEADAPSAVEPVVGVVFAGKAGQLGAMEIGRVVNAERSKPGEPVFDYFARTDRSRKQWVKVGRTAGNDLAEQLPALLE